MGLSYLYPETPERDALSRSMMGYWAQFARTGAPAKGTSGNEVSMASIKSELALDTSIASNETRCRLFVQSFMRNETLDLDEYHGFGPQGCTEYDPASFAF